MNVNKYSRENLLEWEKKKLHLFLSEIPKDEEFLEAVISAMRSLLQIIASKNIPQVHAAV